MKVRIPLRRRVALAYGLMGLVLSLAFALATALAAYDYEDILVEALLAGQAEDYLRQLERFPAAELPRTPQLSVYREAEAPPAIRGLPEGVHEVPGQEDLHAAAFGPADARVVMVIDIGRIERLEEYLAQLIVLVMLAGAGLSAWLGWLLAGRTVAPVVRLAAEVDALPTTPVPTTLAREFGNDEIGRLAAAIDRYQQRLGEAGANERAFFADASHELRTPIAVIQGAVEVLRDDPEATGAQQLRLARVDRGLLELAGLLEALLLSGRGLPAQADTLELAERCRAALSRLDTAGLDGVQRIELLADAPVPLQAPQRWLDCILGVLFQRLLVSSPQGQWSCRVGADGLALQPRQSGEGEASGVSRGDLGLGLIFIERLCRALGWQLEQNAGEHGLQVVLRLPASANDLRDPPVDGSPQGFTS